MTNIIFEVISVIISISVRITACPGGDRNERVDSIGPCGNTEPKCPLGSYCYPAQWQAFWQYQWVCCPNITTGHPPPPPPLFPQPPVTPSVIPPESNFINARRRSRGVPITIPFNDAARQHVPFAIMNLIQQYPILMISLSKCPWCTRAKALFDDYYSTVTYYYFDYDVSPDGNHVANAAMGVSGMRTVPMIYVCQQLIGGFTDLQNLHVANELKSRMEKCTRV